MKFKNNPLNIRWSQYNNWVGQIQPKRGFCQFSELRFGFRAVLRLFYRYRQLGVVTVSDVISRFAPNSENNTQAYINSVCVNGHFRPDDEITFDFSCLLKLICSMYFVEQGERISPLDLSILIDTIVEFLKSIEHES